MVKFLSNISFYVSKGFTYVSPHVLCFKRFYVSPSNDCSTKSWFKAEQNFCRIYILFRYFSIQLILKLKPVLPNLNLFLVYFFFSLGKRAIRHFFTLSTALWSCIVMAHSFTIFCHFQ